MFRRRTTDRSRKNMQRMICRWARTKLKPKNMFRRWSRGDSSRGLALTKRTLFDYAVYCLLNFFISFSNVLRYRKKNYQKKVRFVNFLLLITISIYLWVYI